MDFRKGDIVTYHGHGHPEREGDECEVISYDYGASHYNIIFLDDNRKHECFGKYLKIKFPYEGKRVYTSEDPYGEEDWDY